MELDTEISAASGFSTASEIGATWEMGATSEMPPPVSGASTATPAAASAPQEQGVESVDGREARSRRTRAAIVEAWLDVVEGGNISPTAREIADQASIGLRTVFQHFGDMEDLHAAAAALHAERVRPFVRFEPTGAFPERLAQFSLHRKRLFERITPVRRAALYRAMLAPNIGVLLRAADQVFASIIWDAFAPEVAAVSGAQSAVLHHSAASALSWATWDYLRTSGGLGANEAQAAFELTGRRLFGSPFEL